MLLWANMHGGFILGLVMLGAYLLEALFMRRSMQVKWLAMSLAGCCLATALTPWGITAIPTVLSFMQHSSKAGISEWQSVAARFTGGTDIPAVAYLLIFIPALLGMPRSKKIPAVLTLLCLGLYVQAWYQIRYISVFIVLSMPVAAWGLSQFLPAHAQSAYIPLRPAGRNRLLLAMLACILLLANRHLAHAQELPASRWPKAEIAYVAQHYPDRNLMNHWNYGSYIIYQARGRVKPFIDGRAETAYPPSVFADFDRLYATLNWPQLLKKYNISVVLWPKIDNKMLTFFREAPDWQLAYEGELAAVYVKK
jgi:hypothetical protein